MVTGKCDRCESKAAIELLYGPHKFCKDHFTHFFEKRVKRTCRTNGLVGKGEKLLVAVSGGKDSCVALYLMHKIFGKSNELEALLIDEEIEGYRDAALNFAEENCKAWGIPFTRISFKDEFGFTMVDVMKKTGAKKRIGGTCSFCGVLRRKIMNQYAKKLGANKLVTGHNLDDETQSTLMNVCEADIQRLVRLGPITRMKKGKGFVPRIKPLWDSPEIEIIAFAHYKGVKHYEEQCCPFKWQAKRNTYRSVLNHLESQFPGTMYSILSFLKQAKPKLAGKSAKVKLNACKECGEPTSGKECAACKLIKKITDAK
ncbi:MAG: TIGR00269 family protein [Candidatus Diapherotrites archaeon]|uniref:TIGR00269 family protein n=1 Tax=Candidatus Iainarchaeum sp. TaxID=3101447 RepID=A0A2D6M1G1_9ARCH|nr:TIGR00269 family protein [Candidatus Diapherotrites archaeon]|tara:strand:+ start:47 stop:988 length:942 start_codon:yes stop_codon:yes gene_type:complete